MEKLIVGRKEIITLEQTPLGRKYARRAIKKFREMPGTVLFNEDTQKIVVTHTATYGLPTEEADGDFLEEDGFEL